MNSEPSQTRLNEIGGKTYQPKADAVTTGSQ